MPAKNLPIPKVKSDPTLSISSFPVKAPPDKPHLNTLPDDNVNLNTASESRVPLLAAARPSNVTRKLSPLDADERLYMVESDSELLPNKRSSLIRFRSRVRISSGVPRNQRTARDIKADNLSVISHNSSLASSPAPSIYAPLRSESDDEHSRWGSLGRRVNGSSAGKKKQRKLKETTQRGRQMQIWQYRRYRDDKQAQDERTPLIGRTVQSTLELQNMVRGGHNLDVGTGWPSDEADFVFGTWPTRLLNRYWWWWQLEPVICCYCLDDSDIEY